MIKKIKDLFILTFFVCTIFSGAQAQAGETLDRIKEESIMICAFTQMSKGLAYIDAMGKWTGFFSDYCRAFAIAATGSPKAVEWNLIDTVHRFDALASGEIDVLVANTTWTNRRDTSLGIKFTGAYFYDGQGFLAHKNLGVKTLDELDKASICVGDATTTLLNLQELVNTTHPNLTVKTFNTIETRVNSFFARKCDVLTDDRLALASYQQMSPSISTPLTLFPDVISKEPLSPVVRANDLEWFDVVRWTVFATIAAEELGITSKNVDQMLTSNKPEIRRLLGVEGEIGKSMDLPDDWAYQVIKQVGNYGEIFNRNIGPSTDMNLERGLNALWKDGGLLYAPPFR